MISKLLETVVVVVTTELLKLISKNRTEETLDAIRDRLDRKQKEINTRRKKWN